MIFSKRLGIDVDFHAVTDITGVPKNNIIKIIVTILVIIKTAFSAFNSNATRENILQLRLHKNFISETVESALRNHNWELLFLQLIKKFFIIT